MYMKKLIFLIALLLSFILAACVDENDLKENQNPIVGEWVYDAIEYSIKINDRDIYSYLDSLGIPAENIALISILLESEIKSEFEGQSITFNADNSYEIINNENEIESSGSYELNSDQNQIKLIDQNNDNLELDIITLNENSLAFAVTENIESPNGISTIVGSIEAEILIYLLK